jgi:hypothetical protein
VQPYPATKKTHGYVRGAKNLVNSHAERSSHPVALREGRCAYSALVSENGLPSLSTAPLRPMTS